jgi:Vps16, N-terminal region
MANFTDNWSPFGFDVYYRKLELYQMGWQKFNVDISEFALIAAQNQGGNIAVVRDDRKKTATISSSPTTYVSTALIRPTIVVFSSSGKHTFMKFNGHVCNL